MAPKYVKGIAWLNSEVNELLNIWADDGIQEELAGRLHNQCVFDKISDRLRARGIDRSAEQCREKIKKLKRDYRAVAENNYSPAFARKLLNCYDKLHSVLSKKSVEKPACLLESITVSPTDINPRASTSRDEDYSNHSHLDSNRLCSNSNSPFRIPPPPSSACSPPITPEAIISQVTCLLTEEYSTENAQIKSSEGDGAPNDASSSNSDGQKTVNSNSPIFSSPNSGEKESVRNKSRDEKRSEQQKGKKRKESIRVENFLEKFLGMQEALHNKFLAVEEKRYKQELEMEKRRILMEEKRREEERQHEKRMFQAITNILISGQNLNSLFANGEEKADDTQSNKKD